MGFLAKDPAERRSNRSPTIRPGLVTWPVSRLAAQRQSGNEGLLKSLAESPLVLYGVEGTQGGED